MARPSILLGAAVAAGAFVAGGVIAGGLPGSAAAPRNPALVNAANTTATDTGSSVDSCTLLTEAEAKQALGTEVAKVSNPAQCTYVATDGTSRALSVTVPDYTGSRRDFAPGVEQAAHAFEGSYQQVAVADEAYVIVSSTISEGLARSGDTYVVVVLTSPQGTTAAQVDQLTGLLQTALGRM